MKIFAETAPPLDKLDYSETLDNNFKTFYFAANDLGNFKIEQVRQEKFGAVGTGLSCGVDSFYTVLKHFQSEYPSMNLTHIETFESYTIKDIRRQNQKFIRVQKELPPISICPLLKSAQTLRK